jgi:Bacterial Ig-like domain (group 3)/MBG domain (YGX type)/NHL repeat
MGQQSTTTPPRRRTPLRIVLLLLTLHALQGHAQVVSAITVPLLLPSAIVFDPAGNLYIAETANHVIRKVDINGNITTIAGKGTQGFSTIAGPANAAQLDSPQGLALDTANNLYIADTHNHVIRKLSLTTGIVTTIAGTGAPGFFGDNGPATSAQLDLPTALALDAQNNLYLADTRNHRIRRIAAATGIITTIAGNGTQGFSGDNGPATAAALDSPRATTVSPTALLTLADTGNQRIRQIEAPASLQTMAGLGLTTPGALTLTAPSVIAYGTGAIIATLASGTPATGLITFLDTANATTATLVAVPLTTTTATLNTSTLPAGLHNITATYAGDQTHSSAQSPTFTLTITPRQLTANLTPASLLYGQPIPNIAATLAGLLPQDASSFSATFATAAATLSPTGTYPFTASISGSAAGNYALAITPPNLTISPAPTQITLTDLLAPGTKIAPGAAVTLTSHVAPTTTGQPTGTIVLLDGTILLLTSPVSSVGDSTFTINSLSQGSHTLTALYSGDANFTRSTSSPALITVGIGTAPPSADFTLNATGVTTQTVVSGSSTSFTFAIQLQGNLSSPITLAATGLPNLATASFNPAYLPPGAAPTFTLTIATPNTVARNPAPSMYWALLLFPVAGLALRPRNSRTKVNLVAFAIVSLTLTLVSGCGARINTANLAAVPRTYAITVTGTATTATSSVLQHSATVSLILQTAI